VSDAVFRILILLYYEGETHLSYEDHNHRRIAEILKSLQEEVQRGGQAKSRKVSRGSPSAPLGSDGQSDSKTSTKFNPLGSPFRPLGKSSIRLFSWGNDPQIQDAVIKVALYLQVEREHYYPLGQPLNEGQKNALAGFYSPQLLDQVRIVELEG